MMSALTRRRVSLTPAHPSITMMQEAERELFARDRRSLLAAAGEERAEGSCTAQAVRTLPVAGGAAATACAAFSAARPAIMSLALVIH